ncbi:hypothetical protein [Mucilaginibacter sp. CSA2-8R]|uniref:hypothetical protein n=1 Tax=Mucilaginibacter sp. CSA2-8R TaxID=3141542 RepID=UPI00315D4AC1
MPLKRLIYILLSAWLINALVCFQGSNVFENGHQQILHKTALRHIPNTLLRMLRNYGREVEDDDSTTEKISYNLRYLGCNRLVVKAYWAIIQCIYSTILFDEKHPGKTVFCTIAAHWLPSPDLHIFRLTPF